MSTVAPADVVAFWREAGMGKWFRGGAAFDAECRARWLDAHFAAARREFEHWLDTAEGALALLILLDQIPRNVFRGSGHAFATEYRRKLLGENWMADYVDKANAGGIERILL